MRAFLGTVLSVIAIGVLLIAYGLLSPRAAAAPLAPMANGAYAFQTAQPAGDIVTLGQPSAYDPYAAYRQRLAYPVSDVRAMAPAPASIVPARGVAQARRTSAVGVERATGRNWKKTALIIGGTTAAGAGLGAIFGGGKGALIGAAIGGGASSIYEATKR